MVYSDRRVQRDRRLEPSVKDLQAIRTCLRAVLGRVLVSGTQPHAQCKDAECEHVWGSTGSRPCLFLPACMVLNFNVKTTARKHRAAADQPDTQSSFRPGRRPELCPICTCLLPACYILRYKLNSYPMSSCATHGAYGGTDRPLRQYDISHCH